MLKFDIALVQGLEGSESPKYRLLESLNKLIQQLGVKTLAEGVETKQQAEACRAIGIDYIQGFYFGRPEPVMPSSEA